LTAGREKNSESRSEKPLHDALNVRFPEVVTAGLVRVYGGKTSWVNWSGLATLLADAGRLVSNRMERLLG
jgi:hypothetical protein